MKIAIALLAAMFPSFAAAQTMTAAEAAPTEVQAPVAEVNVIRKGFENLSEGARIYVQKVMARADLYKKGIDGLYGPGTEAATIAFADWIAEKSAGELRFDLSTAKGVTEMFAFLRNKGAEDYLR